MSDFLFDEILKSWHRPVRESSGYSIVRTDEGHDIIINVLGIGEKDIEIKTSRKTLSVKGETKNDKINFTNTVNYQFDISRIYSQIEKVEYQMENGLLIISLILQKEKEKDIKIVRK